MTTSFQKAQIGLIKQQVTKIRKKVTKYQIHLIKSWMIRHSNLSRSLAQWKLNQWQALFLVIRRSNLFQIWQLILLLMTFLSMRLNSKYRILMIHKIWMKSLIIRNLNITFHQMTLNSIQSVFVLIQHHWKHCLHSLLFRRKHNEVLPNHQWMKNNWIFLIIQRHHSWFAEAFS